MINCGLVLEGGGLRGFYTAGVLDAFLEAEIEFPYIIGVSAGVGMGCSYVSKQKGRNHEVLVLVFFNFIKIALRKFYFFRFRFPIMKIDTCFSETYSF